ncbi:MAG TPA: MMPL family transporter [Acetobacteraceae bacterium]|jgi:predicted exporter
MNTAGRMRRAAPILLALLAALLIGAAVSRFINVRSDIADFLPQGRTDAARLMLQELRSGAGTNLILAAVEGAPPGELARISRGLAEGLDRSAQFAFVNNGAQVLDSADEQFLLAHRYLLSGVTTPAAFTTDALRQDLQGLLAQMQSSAAPLAVRYGLADPPGAFLDLAKTWLGQSRIRTVDGVWFAADRDRAMLLARSRAAGLDLAGQDAADAAIRAAFAGTHPGPARLLVTGPAVFAREAADGIRADVRLLSTVSAVLIAALLLWRFRSLWVVGVIAVPIMLSIAAGALAVQIVFGFVHGITFGFGMTMLGVIVDYPVLLIGHRKQAEAAGGTLRRIGASFNLAVASAALGLTGMVFSGFPGISQLGVFSVTGVLAGAAATRWILPRLIVAADLAPVSAGEPGRVLRAEHLRHWRVWGLVPVLAAIIVLIAHPPLLERDLANLSPIPRQARDLDTALRSEIGAPDVGQVVMLRGASAEAVLRQEEQILPVIDGLQKDGAIDGADLAVRFLPSIAIQQARIAALPDDATLRARLTEAAQGLPFRPEAFAPFLADVAASRAMAPLALADIRNPLIAARLQPLLFQRDGGWYGLVVPQRVNDAARFAAAFRGMQNAVYVDIRSETNGIVGFYTAQAWRWLAFGGAAVLLALAIGLRDPWRVARVLLALAAAGVVTIAVLTLAGQRLSLIHIVALQFAAGVGLDYALFFARIQLDDEERARTLRTLVTCNAMTLLTFGLLAFCHTPLLRDIGLTVACGAFACIVFAFLFAGPAPARGSVA